MINLVLSKEMFGVLALLLTFVAFVPYIQSVRTGKTKPHVFSWLIWGVGTVIVFVAQLLDGGGYGAWVIGISGCITFYIAVLAWAKSGDTSIVRMDWVFLILAMSALPLWFVTNTALSAVIVLTIVDLLGFGPSARKAIVHPYEESATFFVIGAVRNVLVVLALQNYSWTTVLFPAAVGIACIAFVALILSRRTVEIQRG